MWTVDSLRLLIENIRGDHPIPAGQGVEPAPKLDTAGLGESLFLVISNREPYVHTSSGGEIKCQVPASGLTTALDPVMRACGGVWIAHGSGDADREASDAEGKVQVPPGEEKYTLKRVWLTKEEEDGYYYGFSNEALWPLCHIAYTRPVFNESDWQTYKKVNRRFAEAALEEMGGRKAFVFIQDYHLALASRIIKEGNPSAVVAQFWHIPWPNREAFRICPWGEEFLDGLLGNDILGFHIQYHCNNFLDTVDRAIEARVDYERFQVTRGGHTTRVRPFPISVDFEDIDRRARSAEVASAADQLRQRLSLGEVAIAVGLDRIDYTKGIPDRLRAIDRFLEKYPQYVGRFVMVQAGVVSRVHVPAYRRLNEEVDGLVQDINWKYQQDHWKPIVYLKEHLAPEVLLALNRIANICMVTSLHDGMNLVAKEFVSSRFDEDGVLILSPYTGAARELGTALLVNPYATDEMAEAIRTALEMPAAERKKRMRAMRMVVRENNVYNWAASIISEMAKLA